MDVTWQKVVSKESVLRSWDFDKKGISWEKELSGKVCLTLKKKKNTKQNVFLVMQIIDSQKGSVGRDLAAHPISTTCCGQGYCPQDQAAQGSIPCPVC